MVKERREERREGEILANWEVFMSITDALFLVSVTPFILVLPGASCTLLASRSFFFFTHSHSFAFFLAFTRCVFYRLWIGHEKWNRVTIFPLLLMCVYVSDSALSLFLSHNQTAASNFGEREREERGEEEEEEEMLGHQFSHASFISHSHSLLHFSFSREQVCSACERSILWFID